MQCSTFQVVSGLKVVWCILELETVFPETLSDYRVNWIFIEIVQMPLK